MDTKATLNVVHCVDVILQDAAAEDVAFLVVGDPLGYN